LLGDLLPQLDAEAGERAFIFVYEWFDQSRGDTERLRLGLPKRLRGEQTKKQRHDESLHSIYPHEDFPWWQHGTGAIVYPT
jgi:hypothetical protein